MQFNIRMIHSFLNRLLSKCDHHHYFGEKVQMQGWKDIFMEHLPMIQTYRLINHWNN